MPLHELCLKGYPLHDAVSSPNVVDQYLSTEFSLLCVGNFDRGEARKAEVGLGQVSESDHRELVGDPYSPVPCCGKRSLGDTVICHKRRTHLCRGVDGAQRIVSDPLLIQAAPRAPFEEFFTVGDTILIEGKEVAPFDLLCVGKLTIVLRKQDLPMSS